MRRVTYLVHDLNDPAVRRRVRMLRLGGAEVRLAGFRRGETAPALIEDVAPVDLGRTRDAKLVERGLSVAGAYAGLSRHADLFRGAEVVIGRNLETLLLASTGRDRWAPGAALVYEALDVHRLLTDPGPKGRATRRVERALIARCAGLITSSPAFVERYFDAYGQRGATPVTLVENKPLDDPERPLPAAPPRGPVAKDAPIRIGWFGAIRCRKSFQILAAAARAMDGGLEVVIRGRPTPAVFPDLAAEVAAAPGVRFEGGYRNPEDLAAIYGEVDFAWAIDFYEEGLNSDWLLPNRLYEAPAFGAVPIATAGSETARRLCALDTGVILPAPLERSFASWARALSPDALQGLRARLDAVPRQTWICTADDCRALVEGLTERETRRAA